MTEFNLREIRKKDIAQLKKELKERIINPYEAVEDFIEVMLDRDKEFIRLLKEKTDDEDWFTKKDIAFFHRIIDKLAVEKLI